MRVGVDRDNNCLRKFAKMGSPTAAEPNGISNQAQPAAAEQIVRHFELQRPSVFSLHAIPPLYFCIYAGTEANSSSSTQAAAAAATADTHSAGQ